MNRKEISIGFYGLDLHWVGICRVGQEWGKSGASSIAASAFSVLCPHTSTCLVHGNIKILSKSKEGGGREGEGFF